MTTTPLTILCLATYEKGQEFIRECKRQGCRLLLVTADSLRDADWPRDSIDDTFYIPKGTSTEDILKGLAHVARSNAIDRIVALDDFDVETAATMREHLRVPGMGETTARYFRDKLAMRVKARDHGIDVPRFVHVLNDAAIRAFANDVPPPWLIKPRSQAAAIGIIKVESPADLWPAIDGLGDRRSFHLLEEFVPGDIYHVDAIVALRRVLFAAPHKYAQPPMEVAHQGGVFMTRTIDWDGDEARALFELNERLIDTLGLMRGVTHTEFIRAHADGRFYFLETGARVGGAHIVDVVEAATGLNLWDEWAKVEIAGEHGAYTLPPHRRHYAGIVLSLARQEHPDTSTYTDPEIVYRVQRPHHAGLIVASADRARVETLLSDYSRRFMTDFFATEPIRDRPMA